MTDGVAIRSLSESDLPLVRDLAYRIWPAAYGAILTPAQLSNMLAKIYAVENLRAEMESGHRFYGACAGEVVGFASAFRDGDCVWLKKLYVLPAMQGAGVGAALMAAAISAFPGVRTVHLFVHRDNQAAQGYYRRRGFVPVGEQPVKMGDFDFVDLVMAKSLEAV